MDVQKLREQARRVNLLLGAAPDEECPPDLGDFVTEVESLLAMVDQLTAPVAKDRPSYSFSFSVDEPSQPTGTEQPEAAQA